MAVYVNGVKVVVTGASLTVAETEVFSDTSPTTWTDLDLSGVIGANSALVILKFYGVSLYEVAVRKKGDTDEFYDENSADRAGGVALAHEYSDIHQALFVATDSAGKIQWKCKGAVATTVDIIGYIK